MAKNKDFITQITFLEKVNLVNKKNNKIITDYFFDLFRNSPKGFYEFILFIKKYIINCKDDNLLRSKIANIYLEVISFLCERFWLYEEKLKLDDICFKIINPEEYNRIDTLLSKYKEKSKKIINKIYKIFENKIRKENIDVIIKWRYKNIYSIYKKCVNHNNMNILWLNDIFAFRIIVLEDNYEKCFDVLNILHNSFTPLPRRFKDYISIPKINGYQSLHTWLIEVIPELDLMIEVQIRTEKMDKIAESWVAAHFLYWRSKKAKILSKKEEKLLEHITNYGNKKNIKIYCLTPKWDILVIEKWNTVLDFANKIHTNLWKQAKLAIVNWENKKLSYKIKNYDTIEIIK